MATFTLLGLRCEICSKLSQNSKIFLLRYFLTPLTLLVPEKLKKLIFEMPITPQTLNINN